MIDLLDRASMSAKVYRTTPEARIPTRATDHSVGYDLYALKNAEVHYGRVALVKTGLIIQPPQGYFISIRARSSLGRHLVAIPHSIGTIDPDYAGANDEIIVALTLLGPGLPFLIGHGDRVAQLIFEPIYTPMLLEVDHPPLDETRGGFGSSGR